MDGRLVSRISIFVCAILVVGTSAVSAAGAASTRAAIPNSRPSWTRHAVAQGAASSTAAVAGRVYLAPRGGLDNLAATALAISTPGSSTYRRFLTAAQYRGRYQPTSATVGSVASYLSKNGLATSVAVDNRYVAFTGTVHQAEVAFATKITRYRHDGQNVQAPSQSLAIPAELASAVLSVTGLDTTPHVAKPASAPAAPPAGFRNARPCSTFFGQIKAKYQADYSTPLPLFHGKQLSYAPCGYTGPQFRAAYEGNTGLDGSGVTVAITDAYAAKTIASDAETYADNNGDGSYVPGQLTQTDAATFTKAGLCGPQGWAGEETLDVEAVHAMAPAANIHYYGAASCFDDDLLGALAQVVDDDTAQIVTNSWGEPEEGETEGTVPAYESVFLQGAIEGISFAFSSGDNGDELANTAIKQADYPASDPYVTAVGGTSTAIGGAGELANQFGWGTVKYSLSANGGAWNPVGFLYGSGGGASKLFNQPAYQAGTAPGAYRDVPDVAMDGDPNTGMLIGETQAFPEGNHYDEYRIGGTSLASPLFAGMTALALQNGGTAAGLLNPTIYANPSAFTDVKAGPKVNGDVRVDFADGVDASHGLLYSVRTFGQDSSLVVKKGWDTVTGLGSANSSWLSVFGSSPTATG